MPSVAINQSYVCSEQRAESLIFCYALRANTGHTTAYGTRSLISPCYSYHPSKELWRSLFNYDPNCALDFEVV